MRERETPVHAQLLPPHPPTHTHTQKHTHTPIWTHADWLSDREIHSVSTATTARALIITFIRLSPRVCVRTCPCVCACACAHGKSVVFVRVLVRTCKSVGQDETRAATARHAHVHSCKDHTQPHANIQTRKNKGTQKEGVCE